mmetsp:Transcript_52731/g.140693  ORF Transcript_52731/g.140693 Transcript_52731/m.140693 type:complete len:215 (-) Transcript_52731:822-1466(-)
MDPSTLAAQLCRHVFDPLVARCLVVTHHEITPPHDRDAEGSCLLCLGIIGKCTRELSRKNALSSSDVPALLVRGKVLCRQNHIPSTPPLEETTLFPHPSLLHTIRVEVARVASLTLRCRWKKIRVLDLLVRPTRGNGWWNGRSSKRLLGFRSLGRGRFLHFRRWFGSRLLSPWWRTASKRSSQASRKSSWKSSWRSSTENSGQLIHVVPRLSEI